MDFQTDHLVIAIAFCIPMLFYFLIVWAGVNGSVIVYRNYSDVFIVGLLIAWPIMFLIAHFYIFGDQPMMPWMVYALAIILVVTFFIILMRTYNDNRSVFKAVLALYVKIPTGILFFVLLHGALTNANRKKRGQSILGAIFLLPLIYALVYDKRGQGWLTSRLPRQ